MSSGQSGGLAVVLPWGGQDRTFRLPVGAWRKIQDKTGCGPEEIVARLAPAVEGIDRELNFTQAIAFGLAGRWRVDDVREVVFQALMHGDPDLGPVQASTLMRDFFDERPLRENIKLAFAVALVSLDGLPTVQEKPPGEPQGETDGASPTDRSTIAPSTPAADAAA